jgi:hypothetical protein
MLLYGPSELLKYLRANGMIFTVVDESVDTAMLRKLDQLQDGRYQLLAFDSAEPALRGVDYRGHDAGLALLVAKPFATEREKMQAAYRVGRYGERCSRWVLGGMQLIDN